MGISDTIPGVSGATIALILGFYGRLISSLSYLFSKLKQPLQLLKSDKLSFLINLYLGVAIALFLFLQLMNTLINTYPSEVFSFFTGLIIASIFLLVSRDKKELASKWYFTFIGLIIGILIFSINSITASHSYLIIFISGFLAISAMILPGISGSYVLLILNQYSYIVEKVSSLEWEVLAILVGGMILGLFIMSKLLNRLLKKYHSHTLAFLIGLMAGGLRSVITKIGDIQSLIIFGVLGILSIIILNRFAVKK